MKKLALILSLSVFLLSACSSGDSGDKARISELESQVANLEAQLRGASEEGNSSAVSNEIVHDSSDNVQDSNDFNEPGSRKSPVPLGDVYTGLFDRRGEDFGFTVQVSEVVRGEAALLMAQNANRFNEEPEGKEILLAKIDFTLDTFSSDDSFLCSSVYFDFYNGDYSEVSTFISVSGIDSLHAKLFEGGSTQGWLYTAVDPDDPNPLLCFHDTVWLALS